MSVWIGVVAPTGTPAPVLARIHELTQAMMKDEAAKNAMAAAGLDLLTMSQVEFAEFVRSEYLRLGSFWPWLHRAAKPGNSLSRWVW